MGIRKKISAMFPYIRCPFRTSVLESNDFFALRDLVDLSKGAFAGVMRLAHHVGLDAPCWRSYCYCLIATW
ncbi:hypothetical protein BHM03_00028423 [Ensete ventricosum]|nr:hypothetical protein BHM03_00028423 [Ensete ventricosum]